MIRDNKIASCYVFIYVLFIFLVINTKNKFLYSKVNIFVCQFVYYLGCIYYIIFRIVIVAFSMYCVYY